MFKPTLEIYIARIPEICAQDTSSIPNEWKENNPLWGHCAIIAVLTQEIYGGEIWRASLMHIPTLLHVRSHYGNRLPSGAILDVTAPQFGVQYPYQLTFEPSSREHILAPSATRARYELLRKRYASFARALSSYVPPRGESKEDALRPSVPRRKPKK